MISPPRFQGKLTRPYAETKEWLGGWFLLDCPDMAAALSWADAVRPRAPAQSRSDR
jgi:hypothetical protein